MTREEIEEFITQFPIYQYAFTEPSELEFNERVRAICKKECPRYGNSWSCPDVYKRQVSYRASKFSRFTFWIEALVSKINPPPGAPISICRFASSMTCSLVPYSRR